MGNLHCGGHWFDPSQQDLNEITTLISGDAGWVGVLALKLEAESLIKSQISVDKAKAKSATKKTTITCVKGKTTKKVKAIKPKCPTGYKLKK